MLNEREFTVAYTHSVERTEVREIYRTQKNDIYLEETFFSSYGAGLPATTPYSFEMTDEGFRIYDIHLLMDPLVYRTGAVRAHHRLLLGSRETAFLDFSLPTEALAFTVRTEPLFYYLIKEVFYD